MIRLGREIVYWRCATEGKSIQQVVINKQKKESPGISIYLKKIWNAYCESEKRAVASKLDRKGGMKWPSFSWCLLRPSDKQYPLANPTTGLDMLGRVDRKKYSFGSSMC